MPRYKTASRKWPAVLGSSEIIVNVQGDEPLIPPPLIVGRRRASGKPDADIAPAAPLESISELVGGGRKV
jgi:CMP-2-keto-3-deoxyoctulosonic acid synthetase